MTASDPIRAIRGKSAGSWKLPLQRNR